MAQIMEKKFWNLWQGVIGFENFFDSENIYMVQHQKIWVFAQFLKYV